MGVVPACRFLNVRPQGCTLAGRLLHKPDSSHKDGTLSHNLEKFPPEDLTQLKIVAAPAYHRNHSARRDSQYHPSALRGPLFHGFGPGSIDEQEPEQAVRNRFLTPDGR